MKSKFNFLTILFCLAFFITSAGVEKTKDYHESWPASGVESLKVSNKFGEVRINNEGGSEVTIDVLVTVEAGNERKAEDLLDQIEVNIRKSGSTVIAETEIENDFNSRMAFSIDYTINIPSDKNLDISNKFGNTIVNELNAKGTFDIKYGNLTANKLVDPGQGEINLTLGYGKATVETLSDAFIEIKYSSIDVTEAGILDVESKYSKLAIDELEAVEGESKYDTYNLEEVGSVKFTTKYTHLNIEELKKMLRVDSGYGSIKVEEVSEDFESIYIENSYGAVRLGISDDASYDVDASCDYCDIDYNSRDFTGNRMSENHTETIDGKIGDGPSTAKVTVKSRYGGIKLR